MIATHRMWKNEPERLLVIGACLVLALGACQAGTTAPEASDPSETAGPTASRSQAATASPAAGVAVDVEPALETAWQAGAPTTSKARTESPAVDSEGHIWAVASFDDLFWIFDREGAYLESWGTPGSGDGEFNFARDPNDSFGAIAFAPDGGFYVADTGNQRVQRFDPNRTFLTAWGSFGNEDGQFVAPSAVAIGDDGSVFVTDDARHVIQQFTADGTFVQRIADGTAWPLSLATGGGGNLYYIAGLPPTLHRIDAAGAETLRIEISQYIEFPSGITVAPDGHIFVSSLDVSGGSEAPGLLLEFDESGALIHAWPNGGDAIALDPSGDRIYVAFYRWDYIDAYALPAD